MKRRFGRLVVLLAGVPLVFAAGGCGAVSNLWPHTYATSVSPNGLHTASVWRAPSLDPPDDHLFLATRGGPTRRLMDLAPDADWCRTIIWTPDSSKVGFVIADDRLALFDVRTATLEAFFFLAGTGCCGGPLESRNVALNEDASEVSFDRFERATVLIATGGGKQFEAHVSRESPEGLMSRWPLLRPAQNLGREVVRVPVSQIRIRLLAPTSRSLPRRVAVRVVEPTGRNIEVVGTPAADGLVVLPATSDGPLDRLELGFSDGTGKRTVVRGVKSSEGEIVVKVPSAPAG